MIKTYTTEPLVWKTTKYKLYGRHRLPVPIKYILTGIIALLFASCKKETYTSQVYIKKQWKVDMNVQAVIPANTGRTDHAVALIYLMDNNQLSYDIYFDVAVNTGDTPTAAKLFIGSAKENGLPLIDFNQGSFAGGELKGNVQLDDAVTARLLANTIYLQVNSAELPSGLVRGQLSL
ncbi:CHRD domain-containing protein [Pedobacter sp. PAMC26386]|nr:CHRD domain-containing protein [Pedobacter sp. PAMC26386]